MLRVFFMCHYIPVGSSHVQVLIEKHFMSRYCERLMSCVYINDSLQFCPKTVVYKRKKTSFLKRGCAVLTCFITGEIIQQQHTGFTQPSPTEGRCGLRSLLLPADCFAILLYSGGFDLLLSWQPYRKRLT